MVQWRRRRDAPDLMTCACGGRAVSSLRREGVEGTRARISIRCGECGSWRRLEVTVWSLDLHQRRLRRQVDAMAAELDALERARAGGITSNG